MLLTAFLLASMQPGAPIWPTQCVLHEALADAGPIAYRDCGKGPAVLIIPGGPGLDADYVALLARMVAQIHHRALVIEPRGHRCVTIRPR